MDPKDETGGEGADVVSLEEARRKAAESAAAGAEDAGADAGEGEGEPTVTVNAAEFLKPVMAAIARELANVADPDGTVRVGGDDEASRAKTAAVVKGLGVGLGQALADAFGKWAQKIETGQATPGLTADVIIEPRPEHEPDGDPPPAPPKKPS